MAYQPNPIGQQVMASSVGVVIASNQSPVSVTGTVSVGSVAAFIVGSSSIITVSQGSIAVAIISGSIAATFTPPANQSVSGTVGASIIGLPPVNVVGTPSISGAVTIVGASIPNGSISGTVGASIIGLPPFVLGGSTNASVITVGTAAANQSVSGTVGASIIGTVPITQSGTLVASIVSTVPSSVLVGASIFGQLPAGTAPLGSVATLQGTNPWIIVGSVYGNISGSVVAFVTGNPSISGTVTVIQGANAGVGSSWPVKITNGSQTANVNAASMLSVTVDNSPSIIGTYAEDVPSAANDKGLFTLGIRNDTVASLVSGDLDYTGWSTDSAGRHLVKPFSADESRLDTVSSTVSTSVTALFSSVTGLRNYVTDIMIANTGSVATLVTFRDGSTSVLGFTIAPAGGGSNINGMAFPLRTAPGQDFVYVNATASSVLYVTAKGYKAP